AGAARRARPRPRGCPPEGRPLLRRASAAGRHPRRLRPSAEADPVSRRSQFETIRSEGALLPTELLQRVSERDKELGGLRGEDYGLLPNEPLNEAIVRSYNRLIGAWASFQEARMRLPEGEPGTSITRDRWLQALVQ